MRGALNHEQQWIIKYSHCFISVGIRERGFKVFLTDVDYRS